MTLGMPTLIELASVEAHAQLAKELGLAFVELNMSFPLYTEEALASLDLLALSQKYGVTFSLHLDEEMNIAHYSPLVREAYFNTAKGAIRLAKKCGIRILNMHLSHGVWCTLPENKVYLNEVYRKEYHAALSAFQAMCEEETKGTDIRISIENTSGYMPHEWEAIDLLLHAPCFALTLDAGHAYQHPSDLENVLKRKSHLAHMHLHDATQEADHMPLGTGGVDVSKMLALATEQEASVVIEVKTASALRASCEYLRTHHLVP
jgi:sugar phosphate isomerase/epimerase